MDSALKQNFQDQYIQKRLDVSDIPCSYSKYLYLPLTCIHLLPDKMSRTMLVFRTWSHNFAEEGGWNSLFLNEHICVNCKSEIGD